MKTFMSLMAAMVASRSVRRGRPGPGSDPSGPEAGHSGGAHNNAPAVQAPTKAPAVKNITGEFVAMDKAAKTVTVSMS